MSEKDRVFKTMYDGGEPTGGDDLDDPNDNLDNPDDYDVPDAPDKQEYLELFGNRYSLDDEGKTKLVQEAKDFERAYHDQRRELADLQEILAKDDSDDKQDDDTNQYPFDMEQLSDEDKQVVNLLTQLVNGVTEKQISKALEPLLDKQLEREIEAELKEIKSTYGDFDEQELLKYAKSNRLEGNLMAAYRSMTFDKQIEKGRKLEQADMRRKKEGILPSGSKTGGDKIPKYDKKKHAKMSLRDILEGNL